jgi:hypothetical protein
MADWSPKRQEIEGQRSFNVAKTKFENKSEEARLLTPDELISFKITSPQLTYAQLQDYITFWKGKFGSLTSFTILYPFDNTEYTVCFVEGSWRETYRSGSFQIEFSLERIF